MEFKVESRWDLVPITLILDALASMYDSTRIGTVIVVFVSAPTLEARFCPQTNINAGFRRAGKEEEEEKSTDDYW